LFEKLKKAFSDISKTLGQKEISENDINNIAEEILFSLIESDVAHEIAVKIVDKLRSDLLQSRAEKKNSQELTRSMLITLLRNLFESNEKRNILQEIIEKKKLKTGPYVIVFLGINGTGKTTTVAKFSRVLRKLGLSVLLAAGDTHRAGAIEQLNQHGMNLGIKVISQRYGADPSAVARDAVEHARKNYIDAVLVDTAGRIQTSKNLMEEIGKIVRVIKPDMKIFVGDSLSGNDTVNQAREFFQYTNFDGTILTKSDADSKGGAAVSILHLTKKPILFLGIGQGYDDLVEFDSEKFLKSMLETGNDNNDKYLLAKDNKITFNQASIEKDDLKKEPNPEQSASMKYNHQATGDNKTEIPAPLSIIEHQELIPNSESEKLDNGTLCVENELASYKEKSSKKKILGRLFSKEKNNETSVGNVRERKSNQVERVDNNKDRIEPASTDKVVYLSDDDIDDIVE
jgi:fused signal recognition particle receptor